MSVIECHDVGIKYVTGDLKSIGLKDYIMRKLTGRYHVHDFWSDRGITFSLEKGDMLGIIGTNGAGKSTLLKAITGIMEPSEGTLSVNGKIAALLELSAGFDGDMTVRENIYLRGALLHYTKEFIEDKYEAIIDFAELKDFQDYQLKQLSSGMKSRLAFSIACLVNPDILILDEVLSVGDGAFKKKSSDKMKEILNSGITGILVSHSLSQIKNLCNKILWIDHGKQVAFSEETELYCLAYEEFLLTHNLPGSHDEAKKMAEEHKIKVLQENAEKRKKEVKRFEKLLAEDDEENAVSFAVNILQKTRPELLNENNSRMQ